MEVTDMVMWATRQAENFPVGWRVHKTKDGTLHVFVQASMTSYHRLGDL